MLLSPLQTLAIFISLFISSYLLSLMVDFKRSRLAIRLSPFWAAVLFPFTRLREYNVTSVCLQLSNYLHLLLYFICVLAKYEGELLQIAIVALLLIITLLAIIISAIVVKKLNKKEDNINDRPED